MENNKKYFNKYVFLSTLARSLVETFIGTILFKAGFNLHSVICYYLMINVFSFIIAFPAIHISKKYSNKILTIIGILGFISVQVCLNYIRLSHLYLVLLAFLYALYRRCYWMSRRYYTFQVIEKNNVSKSYTWVAILNQLAQLLAGYAGALLLEYVDIHVITAISTGLLLIGLYCVFKLNFEFEINKTKINIIETLKTTPISSIIHIGCYELQNVLQFFLPLYIIIYVKNSYTAVGIINLLAQLATIIFVYIYGAIINKNKNYLKFSIIFFVIFKALQVNTYGIVLFIVTFINGLGTKMYEQSFNKELLLLSNNYEFHNFNFMYECIQNVFRSIVVLICVLFINDIKVMFYIALGTFLIPLLFKFNTEVKNKDSNVIWKEEKKN